MSVGEVAFILRGTVYAQDSEWSLDISRRSFYLLAYTRTSEAEMNDEYARIWKEIDTAKFAWKYEQQATKSLNHDNQ